MGYVKAFGDRIVFAPAGGAGIGIGGGQGGGKTGNPGNGSGTPPGQGGGKPGNGGGTPGRPSVSVGDVTVSEDGVATITLTLDSATTHPVTIVYQTKDNTAAGGSDYTPVSDLLRIPAGETTATVTIPILADTTDEADETFLFSYTARGAAVADGQATITIKDNDAPDTPPILEWTTNEDATSPGTGGPLEIPLLDGVNDLNGDEPWIRSSGKLLRADGTTEVAYTVDAEWNLVVDMNQFTDLAKGEVETVELDYVATDGDGDAPRTLILTVQGRNDAPVVNDVTFNVNEEGGTGDTATERPSTFAFNASDVDDGAELTYTVLDTVDGLTNNDNGTFTFDPVGRFDYLADGQTEVVTFTYRVTDEHGAFADATATITVTGSNDGPIASADEGTTDEDTALTAPVLANDTDPDSSYTHSLNSATVVSGGGSVSIVDNQLIYDPGSDYQSLAEGESTQVVVEYTMSDEHGAASTSTATIQITGVNDAPNATSRGVVIENRAGATSISMLASDVDNGYTLTYEVIDQTGDGVVTHDDPTGSFTFDPDKQFNDLKLGEERDVVVRYRVTDEHGATDTAQVTITVAGTNLAPVAYADSYADGLEDTVWRINAAALTANDTDADGDTLTVVEVGNGVGGSVALTAGEIILTPDANVNGTVTFDYTVDDGYGGRSTSMVAVDVQAVNDAPVGVTDHAETDERMAVTISAAELLANDTDVEGDSLSLVDVGNAVGGTVGLDTDGNVVFQPTPGFYGPASFTYVVEDEGGGRGTGQVEVTVNETIDTRSGWIWVNLETGFGRDQFGNPVDARGIDNVIGTPYDDVLLGNEKANELTGLQGADVLDGRGGIDTVHYDGSDTGVYVNLTSGEGRGGHAEGDRIDRFENVVGSAFDDTLVGNDGVNVIDGGARDDLLEGGAGGDLLKGGAGINRASYAGSTAGVTINLGSDIVTGGDAEGDVFQDIHGLVGSQFDDTLTGDSGANTIDGLGGNDVITGGAGADSLDGGAGDDVVSGGSEGDTLHGGAGTDVLTGDTGNDVLDGGMGADVLDGGGGTDTASYRWSMSSISASLATGGWQGEAAGDTYEGIENLSGSLHNDILRGNDDEGGNTLSGLDGHDILEGGGGADVLDGGAGRDTASYQLAAAPVSVDLSTGATSGVAAAGDVFTSIENLTGTNGDDTLAGDVGVNEIRGLGGNDLLDGRSGADYIIGDEGSDTVTYAASDAGVNINLETNANSGGHAQGDILDGIENVVGSDYNDSLTGDGAVNTLTGGDGDDLLSGGGAADTLEGGGGSDTVSYLDHAAGITVDLAAGVGAEDTLISVENAIGSTHADRLDGDAQANILEGRGGDDLLEGRAGNDPLDGGTGNDTLLGGFGDDSLHGGTGNDLLAGGGGADVLNGGDGSDIADYGASAAGVNVNLHNGSASGGDAAGDTLDGIENLIGSASDDHFEASAVANRLDGGDGIDEVSYTASSQGISVDLAGNISGGHANGDALFSIENLTGSAHRDQLAGDDGVNHLRGGAGDDLLEGRGGADVIDGGAGIDTAGYRDSAEAVAINLSAGIVAGGDAAGDTLIGIENLEGSAGDDSLTGDAGDNLLTGSAGADTLDGGAGIDTAGYETASGGVRASLLAGAVNLGDAAGDTFANIENLLGSSFDDELTGDAAVNVLAGEDGDDVLRGGGAGDSLLGGAGFDVAAYDIATGPVTVDMASGVNSGDQATGDLFDSIEGITGSNAGDSLSGDGKDNWLAGGDGNDLLRGRGGADTLVGGAGEDTATYMASGAAVSVNLELGSGSGGTAQGDRLSGIENLIGSSHNDILTGNAANNILRGGLGADLLTGGTGQDTASYETAAAGVKVNLATGKGTAGEAAGDRLNGVENLIGSAYADELTGDDGVNSLFGGDGNDYLDAGVGNDYLDGGDGYDTVSYSNATTGLVVDLSAPLANSPGDTLISIENINGTAFDDKFTGTSDNNILAGFDGNDTLEGGGGADTLHGGDGIDTASFKDASTGVTADLIHGGQAGDALGDVYISVENLEGSNHNDTLIGDDGANVIDGLGGNDTLIGRDGDDTFHGGAGADHMDGGRGFDWADYVGLGNAVTIDLEGTGLGGEAAGDTFSGIEGVIGTDFNDTLQGNAGANTLIGGTGNDTLQGREGADRLIGGEGEDWAAYTQAMHGVEASLSRVPSNYVNDAAGDRFVSIEHLRGSDYADILTGNSGANSLLGGAGHDILDGRWGADVLDGGAGEDTVSYTSSGAVDVNLLDDTHTGGHAEGDSLVNIENVIGSDYADVVRGDAGVNALYGEEGNDTLYGDSGDDRLVGGAGVDTLEGGAGADYLSGEYASYRGSGAGVRVDLAAARGWGGDAEGDTVHATGIIGSDHDDVLTTSALGRNTISGGDGDDLIHSWGGYDITWEDWNAGRDGRNHLNGGGGNDIVSYELALSSVEVDLAARRGTRTNHRGRQVDDTLWNFENATGTNSADTLLGSSLDNILKGLAGNDRLSGRLGDDLLEGGDGNDWLEGDAGANSLDGGAGTDHATYDQSDAAVQIDLVAGTGQGGHAQGDTLAGIEHLTGSQYADTLTGDGTDNWFEGLGGGDVLVGGGGSDVASYGRSTSAVLIDLENDIVSGGYADGDILVDIEGAEGSAFNDTLIGDNLANTLGGGDGDDFLDGGDGGDALYGGGGVDTLSYERSTAGVSITLGGWGSGGWAENDYVDWSIENLKGSAYDDELGGSGSDNIIEAGAGNDTVHANYGHNTLDGGSGIDTITYHNFDDRPERITVSLEAGERHVTWRTFSYHTAHWVEHTATSTLLGFENVEGSAEGDDLTGDGGVNLIEGDGGDDEIHGRDGNDTLRGGTGNDSLNGGTGSDILNGGLGSDTVSYQDSAAGVYVNFADGSHGGGEADGDVYLSIDNATGSNHADMLIAGADGHALAGLGGDDTLVAGAGADYFHGGAGFDVLDYRGSTDAVSITYDGPYSGGDAQDDRATGIERILTTVGADSIFANKMEIFAGAGDDVMGSTTGGNLFDGGDGIDTVSFTSSEHVRANLVSGTATHTDKTTDSLVDVEDLIGSNFADQLTGDAAANSISGGDGADVIEGHDGADILDGGASSDDFLVYDTSDAGVTVNLNDGTAFGGHAEGDTISGFENLSGSDHDDALSGNANSNILSGRDGDDTLRGLDGDDTLFGNEGADMLLGGGGDDILHGDGQTLSVSLAGEYWLLNDLFPVYPGYKIASDGETLLAGNVTWSKYNYYYEDLHSDPRQANFHTLTTDVTFTSGTVTLSYVGDTPYYSGSYGNGQTNLIVDGIWVDGRFMDAELASTDLERFDDGRMWDGGILTFGVANADTGSGGSNDTLDGGLGNDTLYGRGGDDTLLGGEGNDLLVGGYGADFLDGGAGIDRVTYADAAEAIIVDLAGIGQGGEAEGDTYSSVEIVTGAAFADIIKGDTLDNILSGNEGDDVLSGGGGGDKLYGGNGVDTASYADAITAVTADLSGGVMTGDAAGDYYHSIENLTGSQYGDTLTGDGHANVLSGGSGDDVLIGLAGDDTLIGGEGYDTASFRGARGVRIDLAAKQVSGSDIGTDLLVGIEKVQGSNSYDTVIGGQGIEMVDGAAGLDTIDYSLSAAAVTVDLATGTGSGGDAEGQLYRNLEWVVGSAHDDVIIGGADDNILAGGLGADILDGGDGTDTVYYKRENAAVDVDLAAGTTTTAATTDSLANIEFVVGTQFGDALRGDENDNHLRGGWGDDLLVGRGGGDTLVGGWGIDTVSYVESAAGVVVDLSLGKGLAGSASGDILKGVENLTGSAHGDTLIGSVGDNVLRGGDGDDLFISSNGRDDHFGGDGQDTIDYSSASTGVSVNLTTGKVVGVSNDHGYGDTVHEIENVLGSTGNDHLTGSNVDNILRGASGDDTFVMSAGTDTLKGGLGRDVVVVDDTYDLTGFGKTADGTWQLTAMGGTSTLIDISEVRFTDRTIFLDGRNNVPILYEDTLSGTEDQTLFIPRGDLLANDHDFDGDEFVIVDVGGAVNGTVRLDGDYNVLFSPDADFNGEASFSYTVRDSAGGFATQTATIQISAVQDPPVAADDWQGSLSNIAPTVIAAADLLANDMDADGEALTIVGVSGATGGTADIDADGNALFTPDAGYIGDAAFTYEVEDTTGQRSSATAHFHVATSPESLSVGAASQVNSYTSQDQVAPSITLLNDGSKVFTWMSQGQDLSSWGIYARIVAPDGTAGAEFQVNSYISGSQEQPHVAALADGGFLVTWSAWEEDGSSWGIYGQRYDAAGTPAAVEFDVNNSALGPQYISHSVGLADGGWVIFWGETRDARNGIFGRWFHADGAAVTDDIAIKGCIGLKQSTAELLDDGTLIVVSGGDGQVHAQRIDQDGTFLYGSDVSLNQSSEVSLDAVPDVAALAGGGYVACWEDGEDVYARVYDNAGSARTSEFRLGSDPTVAGGEPALTATPDGGFIAAWSTYQDGESVVLAQRYDQNGSAVSGEILVGTGSSPSLATLADGGFTVAWNSSDGSGSGIQSRSFMVTGAGNDVVLNTSADETLAGGNGADIYVFDHSDGRDVVNNVGHGTDGDSVRFGTGITVDQLWFEQAGDDLRVSAIGTTNSITVDDWYLDGGANRVSNFEAGGKELTATNVQNLVSAMATFDPPPAGQTELSPEQHAGLDPVIAANWQPAT